MCKIGEILECVLSGMDAKFFQAAHPMDALHKGAKMNSVYDYLFSAVQNK